MRQLGPKHWPRLPGPEVCELCGWPREHHELFVSETEGTEGMTVCIYHPEVMEPNWRDLRGYASLLAEAASLAQRVEPIGDDLWWETPRYILREDGSTLRRENTTSGFARES